MQFHICWQETKTGTLLFTKKYILYCPSPMLLLQRPFWAVTFYYYSADYIVNTIMVSLPAKLIIAWSLLGLLFWLPFFRRNDHFCLWHSIPLFLLPFIVMATDIFKSGIIEWRDIFNLFRVYASGLLIYALAVAILTVVRFLILRFVFPKHHAA